MTDYYEWVGVDASGKATTYQCMAPAAATESQVTEHLMQSYRNLTITSVRRIEARELKPSTGPVSRKAFTFGIIEQVESELGISRGVMAGSLLRMAEGKAKGKRSLIRDATDELWEITKPKTKPNRFPIGRSLLRI